MWIYGSGFPKSLSLRTLGEDYERFGTALKPAFEPIWIVRKPLPKGSTIAATAQEWGTACLDIDGARVASGGEHKRGVIKSASTGRAVSYQAALNGGMSGDGFEATDHDGGRWPANVVFSHLPGCELVGSKRVKRKGGIPKTKINRGMFGSIQPGAVYGDEDGKETVQDWRCVEGCAVKALGEQSGESGDTAHNRGLDGAGLTYNLSRNEDRKRGHTDEGASAGGFGDAGGASRYFHQFEAPPVPFRYCAKCSRREREAGCEHLPPWTPGRATGGREEDSPGLDSPRAGSGRSSAIRNHHPTVKPSKGLLDWLVKLVCPRVPGFEPVVLDPFCGSGSTGLGCVHAGVDFVGIDLDERYTKIAKARIYHADPAQAVASGEALEDVDKGEQGRLF
ncbi:MAG: hypothetical protein CMJ75_16180 [Planctomycetaceae bacterium]|nr:hypothetical protein [Planctomycetaceae bacterium]